MKTFHDAASGPPGSLTIEPPAPPGATPPLAILATFGTGGDLEPFILVARGLRARGHRVCIVASRDHAPRLRDCGLPHRLYGTLPQIDAMLDDPELWHERKGLGVLGRGLAAILPEAVEAIESLAGEGPCAALCHPFMLPAADIVRSRHAGLRVVGAWLAPSNLRSLQDPMMLGPRRIPAWVPLAWRRALWRFVDRRWVDNVMLPGLDAVRAAHGLAPVDRYFDHLADVCDASVGLFPAWFAPRACDWPSPFIEAGFPLATAPASIRLPEPVERFLAQGEAPVVVTFGTGMRHAADVFERCRRALRALGRRGLFVSRHAAQIPADLGPGILRVPQLPFETLLPRVAAIVHHGGIGTAAQALRAGIPQLVVASGFDQFDNGERLRTLGVGDMLPASRAGARALRRRLEALLDSASTRHACAAIRRHMEADDPAAALMKGVAAAIAPHGPAWRPSREGERAGYGTAYARQLPLMRP